MNTQSRHLQELSDFLTSLKGKKDTAGVLEDLLTPREFSFIAERLQIMKALAQGKTHREISSHLKVSIGKVTRGSRVLQFGKINWQKVFKGNAVKKNST